MAETSLETVLDRARYFLGNTPDSVPIEDGIAHDLVRDLCLQLRAQRDAWAQVFGSTEDGDEAMRLNSPEPGIGPWQRPDYPGDDIYPPFACSDKMRSGGVNIGSTRQLVHDLLAEILDGGWDSALDSFGDQACTQAEYGQFLHDLLDLRGEFGRLLLVLAAAVRAEDDRRTEVLAPHGPIVNITPGDPDAVQLPPAWWDDPDLRRPVTAQLRRCLGALDNDLLCTCGDGLSARQGARCANCTAGEAASA